MMRNFLIGWVLACTCGAALSGAIESALLNIPVLVAIMRPFLIPLELGDAQGETGPMAAMEVGVAVLAVVGVAVAAVVFALPQAIVLRHYVPIRAWLLSTLYGVAFGVLAGGAVAAVAFIVSEGVVRELVLAPQGSGPLHPSFASPAYVAASQWGARIGKIVGGATAGAILGATQRGLIRTLVEPATWWMVGSMLAGALMSPLVVEGFQASVSHSLSGVVMHSGAGLVYGVVMGASFFAVVRDSPAARQASSVRTTEPARRS